MTDVALAPTITPTDDDVVHYTCCRDEERSLCGQHLPDLDWEFPDEDGPVDCGACLIADALAQCPLGGECPNG